MKQLISKKTLTLLGGIALVLTVPLAIVVAFPTTPVSTFSGLHVQSNKLVNDQSQPVILHGVNRSGGEYACIRGRGFMDGPSDAPSIQAMKTWGINAIRLQLNEHCWLGLSDVPAQDGGANYQHFIINFVHTLNQFDIYVILDLQWSGSGANGTDNQPMANQEHSLDFWKSVAATFKDNTTVLFDVLNEPHPDNNRDTTAGWQCWRDGGVCAGISYPVAGMQSLVTAIRSMGATNIIMLGGLQYANALTQWLTYKPNDPLNNLAASWHVYPDNNPCNDVHCYDRVVAPIIKQVPVITGEIGIANCDTSNQVHTTLNWLDKHQASYLAWAWDTWGTSCSSFSLISNYNGTPTVWGQVYKNHLSHLMRNML